MSSPPATQAARVFLIDRCHKTPLIPGKDLTFFLEYSSALVKYKRQMMTWIGQGHNDMIPSTCFGSPPYRIKGQMWLPRNNACYIPPWYQICLHYCDRPVVSHHLSSSSISFHSFDDLMCTQCEFVSCQQSLLINLEGQTEDSSTVFRRACISNITHVQNTNSGGSFRTPKIQTGHINMSDWSVGTLLFYYSC